MKKLILQVQISIDGFVSAGPNDEQHWVTWAWDEIRPTVMGLAHNADTILLGRKLAVDYIPYWEGVFTRPDEQLHEVSEVVVNAKKVVFSHTLTKSEWNNTVIANGDITAEVNALKQQPGKDIMVYGGNTLVSSLIAAGLIDEFYLFVNPVALGKGDGIFGGLQNFKQLKLVKSETFNCGIVLLHYSKK